MITSNELIKLNCNKRKILEPLLIITSPFAPHICEELWNKLGNTNSISEANYPNIIDEYLKEEEYEYPIMINGKLRTKQKFGLNISNSEIEKSVMENKIVDRWVEGKRIKKIIIVPKKIINIVSQ